MARANVIVSDVSSKFVPEDKHVRMVIERHPVLGDEMVELDASLSEVAPMLESTGQYILIKFHMPDGSVQSSVVEIAVFDGQFNGDPYTVLKEAKRVTATKATGNGTKRSKEELDEIRTWAKANGWPDIKDRGRIPAEVEDAYSAANPAA